MTNKDTVLGAARGCGAAITLVESAAVNAFSERVIRTSRTISRDGHGRVTLSGDEFRIVEVDPKAGVLVAATHLGGPVTVALGGVAFKRRLHDALN